MPTVREVQSLKEAVAYLEGESARTSGALEEMQKALGTKSLSEAESKLNAMKADLSKLEGEYERLAGPFWDEYEALAGGGGAG